MHEYLVWFPASILFNKIKIINKIKKLIKFCDNYSGIRPSYSEFEYFVISCGAKILYEKPDYYELT